MAIDVSRKTTGLIPLPKEISNEIWSDVQEQSVVQAHAQRVAIPAGGKSIPIITGDPEAEWVAETDEKPVGDSTFGSKTITPYKMALIELFSDEFRRDYDALYGALVQRLPGALSLLFDRTALGYLPAPGSGFDTLAAAPQVEVTGVNGYLDAMRSVVSAGNRSSVDSWVLSELAEIDALGYNDGQGRPLLISDLANEGSIGRILARPVYRNNNVVDGDVIGLAGDWSEAVWGTVADISFDINTNATVNKGGTQINLWQRNMFAVRIECEVAFAVRDVNRFVKLTSAGS